jgi:hypothetical protein
MAVSTHNDPALYPEDALAVLRHDDNGYLHVWECPHVLVGSPDDERCGFIARGDKGEPGFCPYDHGERVQLVPIVAVVLCSDCGEHIMRDDARAPDGRLICGNCAMSYIGKYAS